MEEPQFDANYEQYHPGKISNETFIEVDTDKFLPGVAPESQVSGGKEPEVIDRYIRAQATEYSDYEICSTEMWKFLSEAYGYDYEVRRYYKKGSWSYYTSLEVSMKSVPVILVLCDKVKELEINGQNYMTRFIQTQKIASYSDLKKRIASCVSQFAGKAIDVQSVRMWSASTRSQDFQDSLSNVKKYLENDAPMQAALGETEENTGIECGQNQSLEAYCGSSMTLEDKLFVDEVIIVEVCNKDDQFLFKYTKRDKVKFGKCEWCNNSKILEVSCKCNRVAYCNETCMQRDRTFHIKDCSAQYDDELKTENAEKSVNAKNGIVGLSNLGNTCFMNSSLQCLSNCYELTKFFLDQKHTYTSQVAKDNVLSTEGKLALAYGKILNEMWLQDAYCVNPGIFKRILGQYATQFQGYDQHDSHECITTILDLLGEDLFRKGRKPYIDMDPKEDMPDEEAAQDAWNRHLLRNESVISDLFYGQYKSTINCNQCNRLSVTFDPMSTVLVQIPSGTVTMKFYYLPYDINNEFINKQGSITIKSSDSIMTFRKLVQEKYGINMANYTVAKVNENEFVKYFHMHQSFPDDLIDSKGKNLLLYEVNPALNPQYPQQVDARDSNNGIDEQWTRLNLNMSNQKKSTYSYSRFSHDKMLPRMMWMNKQWTLKDLHLKVFEYFRQVFAEWLEYHEKAARGEQNDFRGLVDFPFGNELTKKQFMAMDVNKCFEMCFPGLLSEDFDASSDSFEIKDLPYKLSFKSVRNYSTYKCYYCEQNMCDDCMVPYTSDTTVEQVLAKLKLDSNGNLFSNQSYSRDEDVQVNLIWHMDIDRRLFDFLIKIQNFNSNETDDNSKKAGVQLADCLKEFKQTETLDEDNMWYCNKCKDHVQAKKTLEIFKVPRVMIISLKRFRTTRKISWGGSKKIESLVNFPLEGLDMAPYVLSEKQKNAGPLIYDCFAVSNHFGGLGGGHYTAFAQNCMTKQWYDFDDSHASPVEPSAAITTAAYSLFYRRRDHVKDLTNINHDEIKELSEESFVQALADHEAAKQAAKLAKKK